MHFTPFAFSMISQTSLWSSLRGEREIPLRGYIFVCLSLWFQCWRFVFVFSSDICLLLRLSAFAGRSAEAIKSYLYHETALALSVLHRAPKRGGEICAYTHTRTGPDCLLVLCVCVCWVPPLVLYAAGIERAAREMMAPRGGCLWGRERESTALPAFCFGGRLRSLPFIPPHRQTSLTLSINISIFR